MRSKWSGLLVRLILSVGLVSSVAFGIVGGVSAATIIYVRSNATGANNGTSWMNAYKSLQTALAHAPAGSGDQIWVAKGTYRPTTGTGRTKSFILKNGVAIYGGFAGTETLFSQRNPKLNVTTLNGLIGGSLHSLHVVRSSASNSTAILDGFTISGGNADGTTIDTGGGGIYNSGSSPTLRNLVIQNNLADIGAGMFNYNNSHPRLTGLTFSSNGSVHGGGGMYNDVSNPMLINVTFKGNTDINDEGGGMDNYQSSPTLTNVAFLGNSAPTGGGMDNYQSNPILTNVTFVSNTASIGGGGIFNSFSSPVLVRVSFKFNSTLKDGGGIFSFQVSNPTLTNVTFLSNSAGGNGGGMFDSYSNAQLTGVTFASNSAGAGGGAMYNVNSNPLLTNVTLTGNSAADASGLYNSSSNPTLTNVTFSGNSSPGVGGMYNSGSNPIIRDSIFWADGSSEILNFFSTPDIRDSIVAGGCPLSSTCLNIYPADPKLGLLQNNGGFTKTMALGAGSAALDDGNSATCAAKDQRGVSRPQGGGCDIGAYEVKVMSFRSTGAYDGQVLESAKRSNIGGSLDSAGGVFRVGDDKSNRRFRGFLSFNTAPLPDAATIVLAKVTVRQQTMPAGNPFITQGSLVADLAKPYFGASPSLQLSDWQAAATVGSVGSFLPDGSLFWTVLNGAGQSHVNKIGSTQFRLRFSGPDAYNSLADYITLYSGNATTASNRPLLSIYYNP